MINFKNEKKLSVLRIGPNLYRPGSGLLSDSTPYDYTSIMHATNQHSEDINIDTSKPVIERKDGQQSKSKIKEKKISDRLSLVWDFIGVFLSFFRVYFFYVVVYYLFSSSIVFIDF